MAKKLTPEQIQRAIEEFVDLVMKDPKLLKRYFRHLLKEAEKNRRTLARHLSRSRVRPIREK